MKLKLSVLLLMALATLFISAADVRADEPLPPPADHWVYSANRKYAAFFSVKEKKTIVYQIVKAMGRKQKKNKMWEMEGWHRNAYLSNDGQNLIVFYNGANLLELNYKIDETVISFYDRGNLLKEIRLNQLIDNPVPEKLEKTVSHYRWVNTYGLNVRQVFEVNTIEKKQFLFDIKTGLPINASLFSSNTNETQNLPINAAAPPNTNANTVNANSQNQKAVCPALFGFVGSALLAVQLTGLSNGENRKV